MKDSEELLIQPFTLRLRTRELQALRADAELRRTSPADVLRSLLQQTYGLPLDEVWSREQALAMRRGE